MKAFKRKKLEAAGWKVGSAAEFLNLSAADEMLVCMKLALARQVRSMRLQKNLTQAELAKLIGSSQSRIAKLETADRSVSIELLVRALVTLGASREQIGKILGKRDVNQRKTVG